MKLPFYLFYKERKEVLYAETEKEIHNTKKRIIYRSPISIEKNSVHNNAKGG